MGSYKDKHEIVKHSDIVDCETVARERILSSSLVFDIIMWTAAATNPYKLNVKLSALLRTANARSASFNTTLPSAVAQCLPGHVVRLLFFGWSGSRVKLQ